MTEPGGQWRRVKVEGERNLYLAGDDYWACATPPGERQAAWAKIGPVGIMQARRARDTFVAKVRDGEVTSKAQPKIRIAALADLFLERCRERVDAGMLAPRTYEGYDLALRLHFKPTFGSRVATSVDGDDLVRWHEQQRKSGAADTTIRGRWIAVRGMLAFGVRRRYLPTNPADALTRDEVPPTGGAAVRWLNREEMTALLRAARPRFRVAVAVMMFTGMRASEALGLVWDDVDFEAGVIRVRYQMSRGRRPKRVKLKRSRAARRDVIMIDDLAKVLVAHKLQTMWNADDDLVLTSTVGTTMTYRRLSEAMIYARKQAGITGVSSHTLRHTFASILIFLGRDAVFVSRQLGHSKPSTTWNVYSHLFDAARQAKEAREEFGREFGGLLAAGGGFATSTLKAVPEIHGDLRRSRNGRKR